MIDTAGSDSTAVGAIVAGAEQRVLAQFKNLLTAGQVALDVGGGLGAFASAASPFSSFGAQTLQIGSTGAGQELYGGLIDLIVARGLFTLAEMSAIP